MSSIFTSVTAWRRMLFTALIALIAALAVSAGRPADAHAFVDPSIVLQGTQGWVYVRDEPRACPAIWPTPKSCLLPSTRTAWRWNYRTRSWSAVSIYANTQVYTWQYSGSWNYIWNQRIGTLVIQRGDLTTGRTCPAGAYC